LRKLCAKTNKPLTKAPHIAWSINDVSAYLPRYAPSDERMFMMPNKTYQVFTKFAEGINKPLRKLTLPDGVIIELSGFFKKLLENSIERKLHTFKYIRW